MRPKKRERAMENFFKESTLVCLRELALRQTAHELDIRETSEIPEEKKEIRASPVVTKRNPGSDFDLCHCGPLHSHAHPAGPQNGRLPWLPIALPLVYCRVRASHRPADERVEAIETHLNFARNLHVEARILEGNDPAETIVEFARRNQITQILLGRPKYHSWSRLLGTDLILRIVRKAKDIRVIILAERRRQYQQSAV